jgi:hypothetical protein
MAAKILYDKDADLSLLKGKTIAILGYGSQGHAQALNLRDSGCQVVISELPGTKNYDLAVSHGFQPLDIEEATKRGDLINILLPSDLLQQQFLLAFSMRLEHPVAGRTAGGHLSQSHPSQSPAGQRADVLARFQRPLWPSRAAAGR